MKSINKGIYVINTGQVEKKFTIYKIGKSTNIEKRYKELKTRWPFAKLDGFCDCSMYNEGYILSDIENFIHKTLQDYNMKPKFSRDVELFGLHEDNNPIQFINSMVSDDERKISYMLRNVPLKNIVFEAIHDDQKSKKIIKSNPHAKEQITINRLKDKQFDDKLRKITTTQERKLVNIDLRNGKIVKKPLLFNGIKTTKEYTQDEQERICHTRSGLPIPREYRDEYMEIAVEQD